MTKKKIDVALAITKRKSKRRGRRILKRPYATIKLKRKKKPTAKQIKASQKAGAEDVELHTGCFANAENSEELDREYQRLVSAAELSHQEKLKVNAGHGLNYINTQLICGLPHLRELNIGHSIVSRAIFVGISQAVQEMREIINLNS